MPQVSVFIPTFNGADNIAECLDSVLEQKLPRGYKLEVIVIDSGSTDGTVEILNYYTDRIKLSQIPNHEFSHGGTRQMAAEIAKGKFILFLTQDATPFNRTWLLNMLKPFSLDNKVGCVFGRQIPRPDAPVTIKREVSEVFASLGPVDTVTIHRPVPLDVKQGKTPVNTFFSDVNSAVRRSLLIGEVPFRRVNYAEDQALAEDMFKHGYYKAYAPLGAVWHSNHYSAREYFHRKFDEYVGLQETISFRELPSRRSLLLGWIRPTRKDWRFALEDKDYRWASKITWILKAPFYNFGLEAGKYFALQKIHSSRARKKLSLESKKKP